MEDAPAAAAAAPAMPIDPPGEKFTLRGRLERGTGTGSGTGAAGVVVHGPWRDIAGAIGAQSRYMLEHSAHIDLTTMALPPDGTYPGRMNFGGGASSGGAAQSKRHQMVDRMALRFFAVGEAGETARCEGEGQNRVGAYVVRGELTREGAGWAVELTRTYTGAPPVAPQPKKRSLSIAHADSETPVRKPRAAAPPKGAWGAQPKALPEADQPEVMVAKTPAAKKTPKSTPKAAKQSQSMSFAPPAAVERSCIAVIFGSRGGVATVHSSASIAEAERLTKGLEAEVECAVRASSADSDGVLFPLGSDSSSGHAKPPTHVVLIDVLTPPGGLELGKIKKQPPRGGAPVTANWKASVYGFSTARRAATYALHAYRTCGPQLVSLEWHAFATSSDQAEPRMALNGEGVFDQSLPIADLANLDSLAALKY